MDKFEDKQTKWEGLWYHQDGKYFSSAAINLSKLKNFKDTIRFFEHEIGIRDVKDGERLYTQ